MRTCTICHCETELDDVVAARPNGRCICLRCFDRETASARPMPKVLRRALTAVLGAD